MKPYDMRLTLLFLFLFAAVAPSQEWTRFRGPNGAGISEAKSIPIKWTEAEVNWQVPLPGVGHSSPVIWGDRLFIMSADPKTAKQFVVCLNAKSGEKNWQKSAQLSTYKIHPRNSFASVTPTVDDRAVYVAWSTPEETTVTAFSHAGDKLWQRPLGPYDSSHGFGCSPILYKDLVIIGHQQRKPTQNGPRTETSSIVALDRTSGEERWRTKLWSEKASYAVPCVLQRDGKPDELICCSTTDGIFSLNPTNGKVNWTKEVFSMRTVSSPYTHDGLVFGSMGSGGGGNKIVVINPETKEVAYEVTRQAPYVPCSVSYFGLAFLWADNGIVTCIDVKTGKPLWTKRLGGNFSGSPVVVNGRVYCISENGEVFVVAAANKFELLGKTSLGEESRATPAVANGRMYLRTDSHLTCIGKPDAV